MIRFTLWALTLGIIRRRKRDSLDQLGLRPIDLCSHVLLMGGSGSGKTSVLKIMLVDIFRRGGDRIGALFAAVKADDWEMVQRVARLAGVSNRLVRLSKSTFTYNFLSWELNRKPGGSPQSASKLLDELNRLANKSTGSGDDAFWQNLFSKMSLFAITIAWLSKREQVNVEHVYKLIMSSPGTLDQVGSAKFQASSFCFQLLREAEASIRDDHERRLYTQAATFFTMEITQIGDRARGATLSQVSAVLGPFLHGDLYDIVCCDNSTFSPEDPCDGAIVVVDFPTMVWGDAGRFIVALITKQVTGFSLARRNPKCMTLIVRDELPAIIGEASHEAENFALARSTNTAFISGAQSTDTLQEALGGNQAENAVHSILANHATKIVLSCDPRTAEMFSKAWGQFRDQFVSVSENKDHEETNILDMFSDDRLLFSVSEQLVPRCPPETFLSLRRGGKANRLCVDALLSQAGRTYGRNGSPFTLVTFKQI